MHLRQRANPTQHIQRQGSKRPRSRLGLLNPPILLVARIRGRNQGKQQVLFKSAQAKISARVGLRNRGSQVRILSGVPARSGEGVRRPGLRNQPEVRSLATHRVRAVHAPRIRVTAGSQATGTHRKPPHGDAAIPCNSPPASGPHLAPTGTVPGPAMRRPGNHHKDQRCNRHAS